MTTPSRDDKGGQMFKKNIEWTEKTWNPVTGCLNDCYYCYARARYKMQGWSFHPTIRRERLSQPLGRQKPTYYFVCSVSDLFGSWVQVDWINAVFDIVKKCPQHTFQFLTKNPERLREFSPYPDNCWIGCTATNQVMAVEALWGLDRIKAKVRFISFEPLLHNIKVIFKRRIEWVIIGACTGGHAKQPEPEWVHSLIDSAGKEGIPIFMKPNLIWHNPTSDFPDPGSPGSLFL